MNHKKAIFLLIFIAIIGAVFLWQSQKEKEKAPEVSNGSWLVPLEPVESSKSDTSFWQTYRNDEYGFEISLTGSWKNYRVRHQEASVASLIPNGEAFIFEVPTVYQNFTYSTGYVMPMTISVFEKKVWNDLEKMEDIGVTYITESKSHVFAYSDGSHDLPPDLQGIDFSVPKIISSFTLLNKSK